MNSLFYVYWNINRIYANSPINIAIKFSYVENTSSQGRNQNFIGVGFSKIFLIQNLIIKVFLNKILTPSKSNDTNSLYCYVIWATLLNRVEGMPWHKSGTTHYHAQIGFPDKGHALK